MKYDEKKEKKGQDESLHANVNANTTSLNLSQHIGTTGTRFMFPHETSSLLLAQMEDYLHGKFISFTIRLTKGDKSKKFSDLQAYGIMFRPDSSANIFYLKFVSKYRVQNLLPKPTQYSDFKKKQQGFNNWGIKKKDFF